MASKIVTEIVEKTEPREIVERLFAMVKESGSLPNNFDKHFPASIVISDDIIPNDVSNLAFILKHVTKQLTLEIRGYFLGDSSARFVREVLPVIQENEFVKVF